MELNKIQLPVSVIVNLYKKSLVEIKTDNKSTVGEKTKSTKYLGQNKKNILFCVKYEGITFIPDARLSFLIRILSACKLSLADIAVINFNQLENTSYKELKTELTPQIFFLFGIEPSAFELPINFPQFQVQVYNNCSFLYLPTIEELENDKILKSKLWVCLRRIFSI